MTSRRRASFECVAKLNMERHGEEINRIILMVRGNLISEGQRMDEEGGVAAASSANGNLEWDSAAKWWKMGEMAKIMRPPPLLYYSFHTQILG